MNSGFYNPHIVHQSSTIHGTPHYNENVNQATPSIQTPIQPVTNMQQHGSPFMATSRPIFTPTANLNFHSEDEDDLDYDPFADLSILSTF